jgi:thiamine kinase-like enzyme
MRFIIFFLTFVHALFANNHETEIRELFNQKFLVSSIDIDRVGVGMTNRNFRVDAKGKNYFVRMGTSHASQLYISRELERHFYTMVQDLDLTPALLYCDINRGILVTPFIFNACNYGKVKGNWTGDPKEVIARCIKAMKRIHSYHGLPSKETPYPFRIMDHYSKIAKKLDVQFPDELKDAITVAKNLDISFGPIVLCHHDFYSGNILFDGNKLWVIDWEYADWDDPFFDLAGFCTEQDFDDAECDLALQEYLPNYQTADKIKLEKMCMLYALKWAMWSWIQMKLEPDLSADIEPLPKRYMTTFWRLANRHTSGVRGLETIVSQPLSSTQELREEPSNR